MWGQRPQPRSPGDLGCRPGLLHPGVGKAASPEPQLSSQLSQGTAGAGWHLAHPSQAENLRVNTSPVFKVLEEVQMKEGAAKHGGSSAELAQSSAPSQQTPCQLRTIAAVS